MSTQRDSDFLIPVHGFPAVLRDAVHDPFKPENFKIAYADFPGLYSSVPEMYRAHFHAALVHIVSCRRHESDFINDPVSVHTAVRYDAIQSGTENYAVRFPVFVFPYVQDSRVVDDNIKLRGCIGIFYITETDGIAEFRHARFQVYVFSRDRQRKQAENDQKDKYKDILFAFVCLSHILIPLFPLLPGIISPFRFILSGAALPPRLEHFIRLR